MGRTEGRKENFIAMRIKSTKIFLEKKKIQEAGGYAQICGCYVHYCYCIAGHSLGALMDLKTKTFRNVYLSSFLQLL